MSGHSKWATIKRKKGAADAKRGRLFTRLGKEISLAARDGGGDPGANPRLRTAIENAKAGSMPKDNIERAIKRGTGEIEGATYAEVTYEAFGPAGVAILIRCVTDNTNRTAAEVRHVLSRYLGKLADRPGSAARFFESKGVITIDPQVADEERVMEVVIDAGAEDVQTQQGEIQVTTPREAFHDVAESLQLAGIATLSAELTSLPNTTVAVAGKDAEAVLRLINALDDMDDATSVSANPDISEEELSQLQDQL